MRNFGNSWLKEMRILVGQDLHTGTGSRLKMPYFGCFWFSFTKERKGDTIVREETVGICFMDTTVLYTRLTCAHFGQIKLLCQENFVSCTFCMNLGTVRSLSNPSSFHVQCTEGQKEKKPCYLAKLQCSLDEFSIQALKVHWKCQILECFWFSFGHRCMVNDRRPHRVGGTAVHMFHGH